MGDSRREVRFDRAIVPVWPTLWMALIQVGVPVLLADGVAVFATVVLYLVWVRREDRHDPPPP